LEQVISREVRLVSAIRARRSHTDFELVSIELPAVRAGEMLVRNMYMSVDAYMHDRLGNASSTLPAFRVGEPLEGSAVGKVIFSAAPGYAPGDAVTSMCGWREYFITTPGSVRRVDPRIQPLSAHLGVLGTSGLAAWAAFHLAELHAGEHVFVSAAGGAVGSVVGQLAKLECCHVVGSADADECEMLVRELGFDAAFGDDWADLAQQLGAASPDGIDVYFDNVRGVQLEPVLAAMRDRGRIITCGSLSAFAEPAPLRSTHNRELFSSKQLTMKGFVVSDWLSLAPLFQKAVSAQLLAGRMRVKEPALEGIERAAHAFDVLSRDETLGKVIVKLA
jgi:NADPH-dependent curcumin reductase CurA